MDYKIVTLGAMRVVGKSVITTNENGQAMHDIGAIWHQYINEGFHERIKNKVSGKGIGLYTDYEGDATMPYRFMCCVEVSESDDPSLETRIIEGGKYAQFTIKGDPVVSVGSAWQTIWGMALDRRFSNDFELYHNESEDMNNQTIDIYISIH